MALGEVIVKAGIMQLPSDPRMTLLYSSFLIDVQGSYQSGYTQLQAAKQQSPGLLDRFAIFSREQEHTQKASGVNGAGDGVVDLVSYVEFQRSHRLVTRAHKEALLAMRAFWSLLLHSRVSFMRLTHAINRIEVSIRSAERAYQSVLTRHGHNARLVRLYGRFLESVKFDPWAAAKWFTEADRLEEREEHAKEAMQLGGALVALGATAGGGGAMAVDGLAALFINSQGIIQVATPEVHALLGYAKGELKDRDVACIMPPPFGDRHNAYLRNYIQTGVSHVLDRTTDFVALTKTRSVAPIRLRISKVSGLSEDSVFMGVMEPLPPQPGVVRAWVMGNGGGTAGATGNTLIAAEEGFYDWLGYGPGELLGQPLSALVNDAPTVDVVIKDLQQSLLTPPIATKATATAAAAVAAGRSRCRSGDLTGPGVPPSQPLSAAQQGQLGSSTGPGSPGVAEGGDRGIGHGGMGRSTGSQMLGFSLAALMLARDTAGGGGKADAALDASDTSAHGNGASGEVGGIVRGVGSRTANQPQPTATLPGLEWRHKYSGSIPLTTILSADAFGSVRYVVISLHTDPNANGEGAAVPSTTPGGAMHDAVHYSGGGAASASAYMAIASAGYGGNAKDSLLPPFAYELGGTGRGRRASVLPQLLRSPAVFSELMLVADQKGRLLHVTAAMAAALGRSVESVRNAGLAALMPEPYGLIHRPWMHLLAVPPGKSWGDNAAATAVGHGAPQPPPHSCRSGVTLSLCGYDESEGPVDVPFRMRLQQRLSTTPKGPGRVHVMAFERRTRNQAMAERRMRLTVDLSGTITAADPAPASLFGVDPRQMVGRSLADLVDVFQLAAQVQGQQQQEQERRAQTQGQQVLEQVRSPSADPTGSSSLEQQQDVQGTLTASITTATGAVASPFSSDRIKGDLKRAGSGAVDLVRMASGTAGSETAGNAVRTPSGSVVAHDAATSGFASAQLHPSSVAADSPLALAGDDPDKLLTLLMLELSKRGSSAEGMSWRVGVSLPADDSADAELQRLRAALGDKHVAAAAAALGAKVVPAVMVVRMVRRPHATAPAASSTAYPTRMPGGGSAYPSGGGLRSGASLGGAGLYGGSVGFGAGAQPLRPNPQTEQYVPLQQYQQDPAAFHSRPVKQGSTDTLQPTEQQYPSSTQQHQKHQQPSAYADRNSGSGDSPLGARNGDADGRSRDRRQPAGEATEWHVCADRGADGFGGDWATGAACLASVPSGMIAERGPAKRQRYRNLPPPPAAPMPPAPPPVPPLSSLTSVGMTAETAVLSATPAPSRSQLPEIDGVVTAASTREESFPKPAPPAARGGGRGADGMPIGSMSGSPLASPRNPLVAAAAAEAAMISSSRSPSFSVPTQQPWTSPQREHGSPRSGSVQTPFASRTASHDHARSVVPQQDQQNCPPSRSVRGSATMPSSKDLAAAQKGHREQSAEEQGQQYNVPAQHGRYRHADPTRIPSNAQAAFQRPFQPTQHEPVWSPQQQRQYHQQPWQPAPQTQQAPALDAAALAPSLRLEVELWRADLLGGVLELDARGRVARVDPHDSLGRAGLILGSPSGGLLNANIATLLPLPPAGAAALLTMPQPAADTIGSRSAPVLRGALKHRSGDAGRSGVVGPPLVLTARHAGDCCEVQLRLQAVRRTGVDGGMYVVLRPHRPTPVQPGFVRWLAAGDAAGLAANPPAGTIGSGSSTLAAGSNAGTLHTSATGLGVLAAMQPAGAPGTPRGVGGTGCAAASPSMKAMAATMAFHDVGRSDLPLVSAGPGSPHGRRASGVVAAAKLAPLPAAAAPAAPSISSPATPTVPEAVVSQAEQAAAIAAARPFTAAVVMPAAEPMVLSPRARPASSKPRPNLTSVAQAAAVRAPAAADGGDVTASSMGSAHEPPPMAWPAGIAVTPAVAASAAAAAASLLDGMATATADAISQAIIAARRGSLRVADQHGTSTDQHVSSTGRTPAELRRRPSFNEPGGGDGAPEAALFGTAQRRHDNLLARSRRGSHLSRLESWVLSSSGIDPDAEPPNRAASSAHSRLLPGAVPAGPTAAGTVSESDAKDDSSHDEVHDGMGQYGSDHDLDTSSADSDEDYDGEAGRQRQRGRKHRSGADPLAEDEAILRTLEGTAGKLDVGDGKATVTSGPALDGAFAAASGSRSGGLPCAGVTELREGILPEGALDSNQGRGGGGGSGSEVGSDASGVGTAFGAGKRFKRLYRLLMGPPSQAHSSRLWWRLLAVVGAILVIHTITFAVMVSRLNLQLNDIRELNDVGAAAARMHDIAINARTLATLYTTHTDAVRAGNAGINASSYNFTPAAGMQVFGEDLAIASRRVLAQMEEMTLELKELQQDIFLGKRKSLRMPTGFGFRDIWELPRLPMVDFYNRNDNITGQLFSAAGYSSNGSLILEPELIRETVPMGLWRASNLFVAAALELAETAEAYVAAGVDFSALASYNFVVYNGMDVLWPAYQDSIDAVVQITIGNGREVYTLMLMILVVEGIVIGLGASAFVWYEAQQFTNYHYNLYTVFVLVPMGLVRGLANMSIELEPGNEDEDALLNNANTLAAAEEDGDGAGGKGMDAGSALAIADPLVLPSPALLDTEVFYGGGKGMFLPPAVTVGVSNGVAASAKPRILRIQSAGRPMASAGFEHPGTLPRYNSGDGDGSGPDAAMADEVAAIAAAAVTGKDLPTGSSKADRGCGATGGGHISTRKVQSSPSMLARAAAAASFSAAHNASRLLSFRFLASNKVAPHFGANSGSGSARAGKPPRRKLVASRRLATLLVLPFLAWSLVLVSIDLSVFATLNGNDGPIASLGILHSTISRLDRTLYYALDLAASSGNATGAAVAHAALSREILEAQVEYDVLLHGREALGWAPSNITHRPHLEQETRGIVWSGHTVTNILYGEGQCLCFDPVKCQPPTSPYFQLTYNGLHLMTTSIFKATRSMLAQPLGGSSGLNSTEFRFIWALAQSDVEGGMYRLIDIYLKEVQKAYEIAETKQIILFVLAVVWAVAFVWLQLRPFLRRARLEMRRIAELLSQLPPELEVEALMTRLVMSCSAGTSTRQDAGGKKRIGKPADDAGRAESSVVGGSEPAGAGGGAAGPGMIGGARRTSVLSLMNGSTAWNGNGHE